MAPQQIDIMRQGTEHGIANHSDPRRVAALFDLDRTITRQGTFTPFLMTVVRDRPAKALHVVPIAAAAARYRLGLISRKHLKEIMLTRILGGLDRREVASYANAFVAEWCQSGLRPGARRALADHKAAGHLLVLATASMDFYAEAFGQKLGFDAVVATKSVWDRSGRLSGLIEGENCYGDAKLRAIQQALPRLRQEFRLISYSDHHTDAPLLRWTDAAVAIEPTRKLRAIADSEGFETQDWDR